MNVLNNIAAPQSLEHLNLINGLMAIAQFMMISYSGIILFTLVFTKFLLNDKNQSNVFFVGLAKKIIKTVTLNKSLPFALGIIPFLSIALGYVQLLRGTGSGVATILFFDFFLFSASIVAVYFYRFSVVFSIAIKKEAQLNEGENVKKEVTGFRKAAFKVSLILLLVSIYIYYSAFNLSLKPEFWSKPYFFLKSVFSTGSLSQFILFLNYSLLLGSLFSYLLIAGGGTSADSIQRKELLQKIVKVSLISVIILPITILFGIISMPGKGLNYYLFIFAGIVLLLVFIGANINYAILRYSFKKYAGVLFGISLLIVGFSVLGNQFAVKTASVTNAALQEKYFENYKVEMEKKFGNFVEKISGKEIFDTKCSACHAFDHKVVGPPYNQVLPQFEGKMDDLVKFILNPVKVNPDYPNMPNQGLRPKEARAIAEFIMKTYKKGKK